MVLHCHRHVKGFFSVEPCQLLRTPLWPWGSNLFYFYFKNHCQPHHRWLTAGDLGTDSQGQPSPCRSPASLSRLLGISSPFSASTEGHGISQMLSLLCRLAQAWLCTMPAGTTLGTADWGHLGWSQAWSISNGQIFRVGALSTSHYYLKLSACAKRRLAANEIMLATVLYKGMGGTQ